MFFNSGDSTRGVPAHGYRARMATPPQHTRTNFVIHYHAAERTPALGAPSRQRGGAAIRHKFRVLTELAVTVDVNPAVVVAAAAAAAAGGGGGGAAPFLRAVGRVVDTDRRRSSPLMSLCVVEYCRRGS